MSDLTKDILFVTHNRLDYTRKSLPRLLEDPSESFHLTIWDNASTDGTQEYLQEETTGFVIELKHDGKQFLYHAGTDRVVLCRNSQ